MQASCTLDAARRATFLVPACERPRMDEILVAGGALTIGGVAGYALGTVRPYPGRSLSITAVMIGLTLLAASGRRGSDA